eukprot:scaffold25273_cov101-Isochrysis_galbana.AAC.3
MSPASLRAPPCPLARADPHPHPPVSGAGRAVRLVPARHPPGSPPLLRFESLRASTRPAVAAPGASSVAARSEFVEHCGGREEYRRGGEDGHRVYAATGKGQCRVGRDGE